MWTEIQTVINHPLLKLGEGQLTLNGIMKLAVLLALVLVAERYLRRLLRRRILAHTHLEPDLQFAVSRFAGYCFLALGFFIALKVVGVAGQVTRINWRSTTVVTNDNITIIVPNSDFISHAVTNWSHGDPKVRLRLSVGVAYGTDIEKLRKVLLEVAAEHPAVLQQPAPSVRFLGFGESSLDFELAVWTIAMAHSPTRFRSELFFGIESKLREHHIEIPFPQRDLHLRSGTWVCSVPATPGSGPVAAGPH